MFSDLVMGMGGSTLLVPETVGDGLELVGLLGLLAELEQPATASITDRPAIVNTACVFLMAHLFS